MEFRPIAVKIFAKIISTLGYKYIQQNQNEVNQTSNADVDFKKEIFRVEGLIYCVILILGVLVFAVYINSKDNKDNEFVFKELIINVLNGKYHKYCTGWDLEAHICKNGQTNCCHDNFVNKPTNAGFKEGKCIDFAFKSSKDELIINLTPLKEVEVKKKV